MPPMTSGVSTPNISVRRVLGILEVPSSNEDRLLCATVGRRRAASRNPFLARPDPAEVKTGPPNGPNAKKPPASRTAASQVFVERAAGQETGGRFVLEPAGQAELVVAADHVID